MKRLLGSEDLFKIKSVSNPQISPNGEEAVIYSHRNRREG